MGHEEVQILWDPMTKEALVVYGKKTARVPGKLKSRGAAIEAGLALCRELGWISESDNRS